MVVVKKIKPKELIMTVQKMQYVAPILNLAGGFCLFSPQGKKKRRKREKLQDSNTGRLS